MAVPVGAVESTVPGTVRSGIASKVTLTFWFATIVDASDSLNGTTSWYVLTLSSTRNCAPPGRVGDAALPGRTGATADDPPAPGIAASLPGASAVVPELG